METTPERYTPTTATVKHRYCRSDLANDVYADEFDRWLVGHDAGLLRDLAVRYEEAGRDVGGLATMAAFLYAEADNMDRISHHG